MDSPKPLHLVRSAQLYLIMLSFHTTSAAFSILRLPSPTCTRTLLFTYLSRQTLRNTTCLDCASRTLSTSVPRSQPSTSRIQTAWRWSIGLFRNDGRRPKLELTRPSTVELVRGMKVRSSVKKLCDGCKVRYAECEFGDSADWRRAFGGKDMFILYARRTRNISRGRDEWIQSGCGGPE